MSAVASRGTAGIGRKRPCGLVRIGKSPAATGEATGTSPPSLRRQSSCPVARSYPPMCFQPFTTICVRLADEDEDEDEDEEEEEEEDELMTSGVDQVGTSSRRVRQSSWPSLAS